MFWNCHVKMSANLEFSEEIKSVYLYFKVISIQMGRINCFYTKWRPGKQGTTVCFLFY